MLLPYNIIYQIKYLLDFGLNIIIRFNCAAILMVINSTKSN